MSGDQWFALSMGVLVIIAFAVGVLLARRG